MSNQQTDHYNETLNEALEELDEKGRDDILTFVFGELKEPNND